MSPHHGWARAWRCARMCARLFALWSALLGPLSAQALVDANRAPAHDLEAIKGIGPSTRDRILQARQAQPFRDWQDFIERVPGIGPARAQKLSAQGLTIHGQPYGGSGSGAGSAGLGAPGPMPSGAVWQRVEPRPLLPLPR